MIKKIDIPKFGLFNNYVWDKSVGKGEAFGKLNIIYGRNYSGKTTVSRIFKCLEDRSIHPQYSEGNFAITFDDGKVISQSSLEELKEEAKIRVYNTDFVRENLSWLHKDDGTIMPFTILGAKNLELDKAIKEIEELLGKEEGPGMLYDLSVSSSEHNLKKSELLGKAGDLDAKLKGEAKKIKDNAKTYNYPTYNITYIKYDIAEAGSSAILTEEQDEQKKKLLKEETLLAIDPLKEAQPNFKGYCDLVEGIISRQIKPSQPIADLVNNSLLQEWVRQGIDKHKNKRETCGFCGNPIGDDLWSKLDAHFSKESEELRNEINKQIQVLESAKLSLDAFLTLSKDVFYPSLTVKFDGLLKRWNSTKKTYSKGIDNLIAKLREREGDIFKEKELGEIEDASSVVLELLKEFNLLINEHNLKTSTLSGDQEKARTELRLSRVAQYLVDIEYENKVAEIESLRKAVEASEVALQKKQDLVAQKVEEKRALEADAKDESKGAELVNQHLTHFFGHNELKLVSESEEQKVKFKIVRDGVDANNLSEGECSLISFCYFIARMEDEMKDAQNVNKLLIYIDDPISSLDSNHIFFMYSLIESIIAKPQKYGQLFISTHNLDFLKYLKRLTKPPKKGVSYFLIERISNVNTRLRLAPDYLKKYITEFNYLFSQIYTCSIIDTETIDHDYQYNFGNNMRKFLEAYLFYKYPSIELSLEKRINMFFDGDTIATTQINRVVNEYSHLEEQL